MKSIKGDVQNLYEDALKHAPGDKPFVIFIDLNSPSTQTDFPQKGWYQDVRAKILTLHTPTESDPDVYNQFVVTNFSFHYGDLAETPSSEYLLIDSSYPLHGLPYQFREHLLTVIDNYSIVPPYPVPSENTN